MIQVNRIYLIFNRLVTKKFLVDTSDMKYLKLSLHKYNRKRKGKSINVKENENNITKTFAYQTERGDLTQYNSIGSPLLLKSSRQNLIILYSNAFSLISFINSRGLFS